MVNTCCFCIGLRPGTIIITALLFIYYLWIPFKYNGTSTLNFTIVQTLANGTKILNPEKIDVSPQVMDYVFAVYLIVVTLAMLLTAILRESEGLFQSLIKFITAFILLTVYSTRGKERGWWFRHKFPPTPTPIPIPFYSTNEVDAMSESTRCLCAVFGYVIGGYFMFVVYSYVQQLRQAISKSDQVISA